MYFLNLSNLSLFEHYQELQPFINRANIALSSVHSGQIGDMKILIRILFRRINFILLDRKEKVPQNDIDRIKLINLLRIRLDETDENDFDELKKFSTKLMQNLIEFNKYISQRIDELAPWRSRSKKSLLD